MWMSRYTCSSHTGNQLIIIKSKYRAGGLRKMLFFLQLLFKVEGQSLTNQREIHKSLISKNVSV